MQGIGILSLTQFLLGLAGVQYLADMGADVIKIEPPGGTLFERTRAGCALFLNGVSAFCLCAHRRRHAGRGPAWRDPACDGGAGRAFRSHPGVCPG
ncbi:MAG: CoA transferase [Candidatus Methylomirabilota bacterium]